MLFDAKKTISLTPEYPSGESGYRRFVVKIKKEVDLIVGHHFYQGISGTACKQQIVHRDRC